MTFSSYDSKSLSFLINSKNTGTSSVCDMENSITRHSVIIISYSQREIVFFLVNKRMESNIDKLLSMFCLKETITYFMHDITCHYSKSPTLPSSILSHSFL
jgi:hypothetical protein